MIAIQIAIKYILLLFVSLAHFKILIRGIVNTLITLSDN